MTAPSDHLSLAADFPQITRDQWLALVGAVLRKSGAAEDVDPEAALSTPTYDDITLAPLYTADDVSGAPGFPGVSPFVRASRRDGNAAGGWDVRQKLTDPDPVRGNVSVLRDLERGATSLWLVLGRGGPPIADLGPILDGVYLDLAPIALDAGAQTEAATEGLLELAATRGVAPAELSGTLGADPIGLRARTGVPADLDVLGRLADAVAGSPGLHVATVDATAYHEAGGGHADELAAAASVGVAYLRALTDAGLDVADALARLEFRYAVTADQFGSIAKLRAARRIWDRIGALCGAPEESRGQRQHAVTSNAMLTRRDPWVNMLRATIACFAAAVGGAEVITVAPFDSAIGVPDDFGRRIARNTSAVLHDEASLARVVDPAGGSYFVERLTDQLADAAWERFTALERSGGALAALDDGSLGAMLERTWTARRRNLASRTDPITGVSEFAFIGEEPVTRPVVSAPEAGGLLPTIRYAQDYEALRDRADAHLAASGNRPRVFLAAAGPYAAYSARVGFATNLFAAGGIETVVGTGSADELATAFTESGSAVACVCSSDKVYAEQAAPVAQALRAAGAARVWLAGKAGERGESDRAAGVDGYLYAGCDALAVLELAQTELGVS